MNNLNWDQQKRIYDRILLQSLGLFGRRELDIIKGGSREIFEEKEQNWNKIYRLEGDKNSCLFYFNMGWIVFIG